MADTQVIVVVDGTVAMGPHWDTLQMEYLNKIIKCYGENKSTGLKPSVSNVEFALVIYNTHGCYSDIIVQRTGWTKDPDVFLYWLSSIPFITGNDFNDAAIAEGLAEALKMFPHSQSGGPNQHCILVAASNPYPFQTPVDVLQKSIDSDPGKQLYDAEAVAKVYPQFSISLSVICPKHLPKVKAIYTAGKRNNEAAAPTIDAKTAPFLILISEGFKEALGALNCSRANQSPVKVAGVNGSFANSQPVPAGNVTPTSEKVESVHATSIVTEPASARSKFISVWEGSLLRKEQGKFVFVTKLECFRYVTASKTLGANWPPVMQIVELVSLELDHMIMKQCAVKADFLFFRSTNKHGFLDQLRENKLCAVIQLPSQKLLLFINDISRCLVGMLFPADMLICNIPLPSYSKVELPSTSISTGLVSVQSKLLSYSKVEVPSTSMSTGPMSETLASNKDVNEKLDLQLVSRKRMREKCSFCKQVGHNKSSCQMMPPPTQASQPTQTAQFSQSAHAAQSQASQPAQAAQSQPAHAAQSQASQGTQTSQRQQAMQTVTGEKRTRQAAKVTQAATGSSSQSNIVKTKDATKKE